MLRDKKKQGRHKMLSLINVKEVLRQKLKACGTWEDSLFLAKDVSEWIEHDVSSVHKMLQMEGQMQLMT